ncbi:hypothetical protein [Candidatus Symbiobacter mobilis]|uniref:hypothetical protein n=1 Tax=Candidatus Symbiobacter mobilis TaxID=1436290 RepID=UPI001EE64858|nr:hypothetical protein [Candidatus Symbiobacter mobilis]
MEQGESMGEVVCTYCNADDPDQPIPIVYRSGNVDNRYVGHAVEHHMPDEQFITLSRKMNLYIFAVTHAPLLPGKVGNKLYISIRIPHHHGLQ